MTRACQGARAIGLRFMAGEGIEPLAVEEKIDGCTESIEVVEITTKDDA